MGHTIKQRSYVAGMHMISSLGFGLEDHLHHLVHNNSGIEERTVGSSKVSISAVNKNILPDKSLKEQSSDLTFFESLAVHSIRAAMKQAFTAGKFPDMVLFFATTKGNIDHIDYYTNRPSDLMHIKSSASKIQQYFEWSTEPITICNACTSGLMALIMAARLIQSGHLSQAVVCGSDLISEFTVQGFSALQALDDSRCKPFDMERNGINLGDCAASVVLTNQPSDIEIMGGGINNDANHISGPSRTGEGLKKAIQAALSASELSQIDFINAHGTATLYNDEMEGQAFHGLELAHIPTNSFKGYWGHTLGAAGLLETAGSILSLRSNTIFASAGYEQHGLSLPLNVIEENESATLRSCLKTSSGFGGSNAALVIRKN